MNNNKELFAQLLKEGTWAGVEAVSLNDCDAAECGEFKGLAVSFKEGDVLEFLGEDTIKVYVREINGRNVLYVPCIRNGERIDHVPVAMFRRKPASSWEKFQEEVDECFDPKVNPLGLALVDNGRCLNDLDRVRLLARTGKVRVGKEFAVHCQRFKDGKPIEAWYEQKTWAYSALVK